MLVLKGFVSSTVRMSKDGRRKRVTETFGKWPRGKLVRTRWEPVGFIDRLKERARRVVARWH